MTDIKPYYSSWPGQEPGHDDFWEKMLTITAVVCSLDSRAQHTIFSIWRHSSQPNTSSNPTPKTREMRKALSSEGE